MRFALAAGAALLSLTAASAAQAYEAYVNEPAPILTGPSPDYPPVVYLHGGETVEVYGCLDGYDWCDVQFLNYRGWFDADLLTSIYDGRRVPLYDYGYDLGLPIIDFSFNDYWGRYYRDRPFFRERERWERIAPPQRREDHRRFEGRPDFERGQGRPDFNRGPDASRGGDFERDRGQARPEFNRAPDFNRGQQFDQQRGQQEQQRMQQQMQQRGQQEQQRVQQEQMQQRGQQEQQRVQQEQMHQRGQQEQQRMQQEQMQQRAPQPQMQPQIPQRAPPPQMPPPPQQQQRPQPAPQPAPAAQPQHVQGTGEHQRYVGPGDRPDNR